MRVNYQSDFKAILSFFRDISQEYKCDPLECDWIADFFTTSQKQFYRVSNLGGVLTNCSVEGDDICAVFDKYDLAPGVLRVMFDMKIPNGNFQDDIQRLSFKKILDIQLVDGVGDGLTSAEIKFITPYIKGDPFTFEDFTPEQLESLRGYPGEPFTYDDFTPEQLADLQKPAVEAAKRADKATEDAVKATQETNTATKSANRAATRANEAAESAETATQNANQAAESANEAAENIPENIVAYTPADNELEVIEPNIVTEALRKTQQYLTDGEKAQVLKNLGITDIKVFIDMWISAGYVYGKHYSDYMPDEVNYPNKPFICNDERLTYEEAIKVYESFTRRLQQDFERTFFANSNKACLPIWMSNGTVRNFVSAFNSCNFNKIVFVSHFNPCNVSIEGNMLAAFNSNLRLTEIEGILNVSGATSIDNAFMYLPKLAEVRVKNIKANINFNHSPLLSYDSVEYMVVNAANTSAITITVHPDVYAKLTDENNTEWYALLGLAASKNIQFATA